MLSSGRLATKSKANGQGGCHYPEWSLLDAGRGSLGLWDFEALTLL